MTDSNRMLHLLQARARLRERLPILPEDENGDIPFSYPGLEGFLYAILIAPFEIDLEIWGVELDSYLPDSCRECDGYLGDVLDLYDDIADALEDGRYFKAHTLSIPRTLSEEEFSRHPLKHWQAGFLSGFTLVESEMKSLPKKLRKSKAYQTMKEEYVSLVLKLILLIHLKIQTDDSSPDPEDTDLSDNPLLSKTLDSTFTFVFENIHTASLLAADRLEQLL